jgi:phosphate transport system substrate-binding protein
MVRRSINLARVATRACFLGVVLASATSLADITVPQGPHVEIRGSLAMGSVARAVAEEYMSSHPEAVVTVSGGGTYRGIKSLIIGTAEMAMATDLVPEELSKFAATRQVTLESQVIFSDAVVVVVSPSNPAVGLSMHELRDIFSGKTMRWADIGVELGPKPRQRGIPSHGRADGGMPVDSGAPEVADIEVVTLGGNTGPYETFKKDVLGSEYVITPRAREVDFKSFEGAIGERAIGYTGLHQVGHLKALQVDGVAASADTVRSGRYPIARQLSIWVKKPASPTVTSLLEYFLAKDHGQRIAESLGNVPVK